MSGEKLDPANSPEAERPTPSEPLAAIVDDAIARLKSNKGEEAEKALNFLKTASEIEKMRAESDKAHADKAKVEIDTHLARKQMTAALISSIFAPLVPLASILAVVVTLLISRDQVRSADQLASQKTEESAWNAFQDSVDKSPPDKLLSTPTFLSRLRKFSSSNKYTKELSDIEFQLMAGVTSNSAFKQLWPLWSPKTDASNITSVIELARGKRQQFDQVAVDCKQIKATGPLPDDQTWTYLGVCSPKHSLDDLTKAIADPATLKSTITYKASLQDLNAIIYFLSNEVAEYIKSTSSKTTGPTKLDLSGITLSGVNFEDMDFSLMNLTQTTFNASSFRGAILTSKAPTWDFRGSTWWDAEKIDQAFLPYLITTLYPHKPGVSYPSGYQITKELYATKVTSLCTSKHNICSQACLRYGSEAPPTAPECQTTK